MSVALIRARQNALFSTCNGCFMSLRRLVAGMRAGFIATGTGPHVAEQRRRATGRRPWSEFGTGRVRRSGSLPARVVRPLVPHALELSERNVELVAIEARREQRRFGRRLQLRGGELP